MSGWERMRNKISVVVISRNEGRELKRTVENYDDTLPAGSEIVGIDDGSTDGSPGQVATRRDVIEATGGWDDSQLQRGNIDNEGCVRFWLLGYELLITPDTVVAHKFRKKSPYHVGWPEFLFNRLRLAFVHFNPQRLGKVV